MSEKPILDELLHVSLYESCLWLDSHNYAVTGVTGDRADEHFPMVAKSLSERLARLRHLYVIQKPLPLPLTEETVGGYYQAWRRGHGHGAAHTLDALRAFSLYLRRKYEVRGTKYEVRSEKNGAAEPRGTF